MHSSVRFVRRRPVASRFPTLRSISPAPHPTIGPALVGLAASLVLALSGVDLHIADRVIALQGGHWSLAQNPILELGLHQLGKKVSAAAWIAVLALFAYTCARPRIKHWRRPLGYLTVSVLAATVAVSLAKKFSGVDCPWDLARYGGSQPYTGLLQAIAALKPRGGCFPAGHASAGYAWVALYFFFGATLPQFRWAGLAAGVLAGLAFGIAQQFRGAHFASHDVMTFAICWLVAWVAFRVAGLPWLPASPSKALGASA